MRSFRLGKLAIASSESTLKLAPDTLRHGSPISIVGNPRTCGRLRTDRWPKTVVDHDPAIAGPRRGVVQPPAW